MWVAKGKTQVQGFHEDTDGVLPLRAGGKAEAGSVEKASEGQFLARLGAKFVGGFEPGVGAGAAGGIVFGDRAADPDGPDFGRGLDVYQFPGDFCQTGVVGWTEIEKGAIFGLEVVAEGFVTDCGTLFGRDEENYKGKTVVQFKETFDSLPGFGLAEVPGRRCHDSVARLWAATIRETSSRTRGWMSYHSGPFRR